MVDASLSQFSLARCYYLHLYSREFRDLQTATCLVSSPIYGPVETDKMTFSRPFFGNATVMDLVQALFLHDTCLTYVGVEDFEQSKSCYVQLVLLGFKS
jgi:hypothetical protein